MSEETYYPKLGSCCCCGGTQNVRNIYQLHKKAPIPGKGGWGCVVCNLPMEGAVAVVCDDCHDEIVAERLAVKFAVAGYPADNQRVPIEELQGDHGHDMAKHRAYERALYHDAEIP